MLNDIGKARIKRKAVFVMETICNNPKCDKRFLDKWYGEDPHRINCPHCHHVNAVVPAGEIENLRKFALEKDIRLGGRYSTHEKKSDFLSLRDKILGEENE
jgi:Zn finger protein HypA/HybF involved in hydrogenase expression